MQRTPMSRKAPTPIRSLPSSAPLEAMVAKQQSHIDDLVAKNRTLEQTLTKVRAELSAEKARVDTGLVQFKTQLKKEQDEWREGCDSLQSLWRITHLRSVVDLEKERLIILQLREQLRQERLATLQRDFQISTFQAREVELEDQLQQHLRERDRQAQQIQETSVLTGNIKQLQAELRQKEQDLEDAVQSKQQLEKTLSGLRKEHTSLVSSSSTNTTALERAKLQIDGLRDNLAESQEKLAATERKVKELNQQVEKWKKLESREDEELEKLRKRKVELEVEVEDLQGRLAESSQAAAQRDKLNTKLDKYKVSLEEHKAALDERDRELDEREDQVSKLEKRNAELETDLQGLRQEVKTLKSQNSGAKRPPGKQPSPTDDDDDQPPSPRHPPPASPSKAKAKAKPKPRPVPKAKPKVPPQPTHSDSDSEIELVDAPVSALLSRRTSNVIGNDEDEIEEIEVPAPKPKKGKGVAAPEPAKKSRGHPKKTAKSLSLEPEDPPSAPAPARKGKRKADEVEPGSSKAPAKRRAKKAVVEDSDDEPPAKAAPKAKSKPAPKAKAKAREPEPEPESDGEVVGAQKKKKRKIGIFQSAQPKAFDWKTLSQGAGGGGLNIPIELSPVKDGDAPSSSLLGKALSNGSGRR